MDNESFLDEQSFLLTVLVWIIYFILIGLGVVALGDESRWEN